ncbi:unnamed protein product [Rotaria sordida]|uniref:Uncharacterized protein n=1 Tax=Rotaria sordida TaxID=392033 RepID=A0A814MU95_9BILA|nr:unnamed protein product [Rotaria sordida]CAF1273618.1 unnamed protein product [Rotaria sordida]
MYAKEIKNCLLLFVIPYCSSTSLPGKIILCLICGKKDRQARCKYTQICTIEREEKVRKAYQTRYNKELSGTLLNQLVHAICYKSLVVGIEPVSVANKIGRPKRKKKYSCLDSNPARILMDITNHPTTITTKSNFFSTEDRNKSFYVGENNEKYTSEFTVECSSNAAPTLSSLIGIHDQISSSSISFVQSEQDIISRNSTEASLITNGITEATSTYEVFEPIINNYNDVFADRQEEDITTSTDIESIEKYTIDSTQTALTYEVFEPIVNNWNNVFADRQEEEDITTSTDVEAIDKYTIDSTQTALTNETIFQDDTRAASPDDDDLSFEMVINDQCTNEVVIRNESIKRKRDKLKRTRKRTYNSSIQQVKIKSNKFGLTPSSIQNNSFHVTSIQSQSIYESSEDERVFQSPYACSTPKLNGMKNNLTSLNFKTPSLTVSLTPRRTPHFRKYFRTTKTASQPDLN